MPAFDPTKVLDPDPAVRIANAYQATLDYAQARLSGPDYTLLLAALVAAGLPTDSNNVLMMPNAALYLDGIMVMAMNFVTSGGREINPATITALSPTIQALRVIGNLTVNGNMAVSGSLTVDAEMAVIEDVNIGLDLTVGRNANVVGSGSITGALGVGQAAPASGMATPGAVQGNRIIMASGQNPTTAANGTMAEDTNGDLFYKDLAGNVRFINRPQHDTGWINLSTGANYAPLINGFLGVNSPNGGPATYTAAVPAKTPDIHAAGGLWLGSPGVVGDVGAITRVMVWSLIDENAFADGVVIDAGAGTVAGNNVATPITVYATTATGNSPFGLLVHLDQVTGGLSITVGEGGIVAGFPRTQILPTLDPVFSTLNNIRVMAWTR